MKPQNPTNGPRAVSGNGRRRRDGMVLVVVIVCLMVAAMMLVAVARQAGTARRAVRTDQFSAQAQWLAEAGVERALARLGADPAYAGETWPIPAKELDGQNDAEVRIQTEKVPSRPDRLDIRVEADYPLSPELRCRRAKQIEVDRERTTPPKAVKNPS
jgi:hypothetical protein